MKKSNKYHPCIIYIRAFNMNHEVKTSSKKPFTLIQAVRYIEKKYGETARVIKIKSGIQVIYNHDFKPFDIEYNLSRKLLKQS